MITVRAEKTSLTTCWIGVNVIIVIHMLKYITIWKANGSLYCLLWRESSY